jgi:hypothetical protein
MSRIENKIRQEQQETARKAEAKEAAERAKQAVKRDEWVEEEKPRIAKYRAKISKIFPSLEGDFIVNPRMTDHTSDSFAAIVTVHNSLLEIRQNTSSSDVFTLFVPHQYSEGYGWQTRYSQHELKSDADLKEQIKLFLQQCDYDEERAQRYYDSLPIGNTD